MTVLAALTLAYLFHSDAPQELPVGTSDWFAEFPGRQVDLPAYIDNTYFFSRSSRTYLFPEIVALEEELMSDAPNILSEDPLPKTVESTLDLSQLIAERWLAHSQMKSGCRRVVPEDRRLRRYLISRIAGVDRESEGWGLTGSISGEWELPVESVEFRLLDAEVQLYEGNVGVVLLTIGVPEDKLNSKEFLKELSAVTKDVLPPNTSLPAAHLRINHGVRIENGWLAILMEITAPFRDGPTPNSQSLLAPVNQEFGQYFRRLWYLPAWEMKDAYEIVRVNYLQPFPRKRPASDERKRPAPDEVFDLDEGWQGLVHHHEFVISGRTNSDEEWWYQEVLANVVAMDYSWLWLLVIVQRARLGLLLSSLDVSVPANAEAELQEFYDFMHRENFAFPSTQPVGNQLAKELSKAMNVDELIQQIEREAAVIRESVLARSARSQSAALAVIALLGTWLSFGELAQDDGTWNLGWFRQRYTGLALLSVFAVYWICREWLLRKTRRRVRP